MTIKRLFIFALLIIVSTTAHAQRFNKKSVYDDLRRGNWEASILAAAGSGLFTLRLDAMPEDALQPFRLDSRARATVKLTPFGHSRFSLARAEVARAKTAVFIYFVAIFGVTLPLAAILVVSQGYGLESLMMC